MIVETDGEKIRTQLKNQNDYYTQSCRVHSNLIYCKNEDMKDIVISICIPTFNRIKEVQKSIKSALNQLYVNENYCIIIVDNDPDLNNKELAYFLQRIDTPSNCAIYYYKNQQNIGMFGNWNKCIELAKTDFIAMLHDDDIIYNDYMKRITKILKKHRKEKIGYIRCSGDQIYGELNRNNHFVRNKLKKIYKCKINSVSKLDCYLSGSAGSLGSPTCGTLINRAALISVKGYNPDFYPASDCYPPYLMMDKYNVYTTVASFGAKYFGNNESIKIDTMRGWLKEYLYFQQYMATESKVAKKIIVFFGDEQYFNFINKYLKKLLELSDIKFKNNMFNDIYIPKINKHKLLILKLLVKIRIYYTYCRTLFCG